MPKSYDVIIIGAGAGGTCAAIYLKRYQINVAIISENVGGLINSAHTIENYPGFKSIDGKGLVKAFKEHLEFLKIPIIKDTVTKITKGFTVYTSKDSYKAKAVIIASGLERRKLGICGEKEFEGKGVTYCATCDAPLFGGLDVGIVGGGDGAASAAVLAAKYAKNVYMIYRKDKLRAEPYWRTMIKKTANINVIHKANVVEIKGKKLLEAVKLDNEKELKVQGLIIEIGQVPTDVLVKDLKVKSDEKGYIMVDQGMKTNVEGVYAVGDVNNASNNFRQIATAVGEGAIASNSVFRWLHSK